MDDKAYGERSTSIPSVNRLKNLMSNTPSLYLERTMGDGMMLLRMGSARNTSG
jgi:hypothetical protein